MEVYLLSRVRWHLCRIFILYSLLLLCSWPLFSQTASQTTPGDSSGFWTNNFKYNGSAVLSTEYINNSNSNNLGNDRTKYIPNFGARGAINLNLTFFNQIHLPFEVWFSTNQVGFQQPFNQFGVNPRIGDWLTLHAGYFTARMSDFTYGDTRMLGGGVELTPGKFRLSALYGKIREARRPDTANYFGGYYNRWAMAYKVGYGSNSSTFVHLNLTKIWDEADTPYNMAYSPLPEENLVTSLSFGFPISKYFRFNAEAAASIFNNDKTAALYDNEDIPAFVNDIFPVRYSTMADAAVKASFFITPHRDYSFKINGMWVGPGFHTLGYAQLPNDVFDITFAPYLKFLKNKLVFKGSIGLRQNNLIGNRVSNTQRIIGSMDAMWQINNNIGLNTQYSNYGIRTAFNRDTLHLQNISQIFSITPMFNYIISDIQNNVNLNYSFQNVSDISSYDNKERNYITNTANILYTLLFRSGLNLTTGFYYNDNRSEFSSRIMSFTETVGYNFFDSKLLANGTIGVTNIHTVKDDNQLSLRLSATYTMEKWGAISFSFSNMNYVAGNAPGAVYQTAESFNEIQTFLQYRLAF